MPQFSVFGVALLRLQVLQRLQPSSVQEDLYLRVPAHWILGSLLFLAIIAVFTGISIALIPH